MVITTEDMSTEILQNYEVVAPNVKAIIDKTKKMKQILLKIVGLSLFGVFCVIVVSQAKTKTTINYDEESIGKYELQSSGILSQYLDGNVNFESTIETDRKSNTRSLLKLKLDNDGNSLPHSIEFLISNENTSEHVSKGSYIISQDSKGVFGFANINSLGELPFFAKSGEVRIDFVDDYTVKGMLNVSLRNANGNSINLEGDFVALK